MSAIRVSPVYIYIVRQNQLPVGRIPFALSIGVARRLAGQISFRGQYARWNSTRGAALFESIFDL